MVVGQWSEAREKRGWFRREERKIDVSYTVLHGNTLYRAISWRASSVVPFQLRGAEYCTPYWRSGGTCPVGTRLRLSGTVDRCIYL